MAPVLQDFTTSAPQALLDLLSAHLPYSLSVLRRLQFARLDRISSPDPHVFFVASEPGYDLLRDWPAGRAPRHFTAAFVDLMRGPEEEMWIYSTLQDGDDGDRDSRGGSATAAAQGAEVGEKEEEEEAADGREESLRVCGEQIRIIMRRMRTLEAACKNTRRPQPGWFMLAGVHRRIWQVLAGMDIVVTKTRLSPTIIWHRKWLVPYDGLPAGKWDPQQAPEQGLRWDVVRLEDTDFVRSRWKYPRARETLATLKSVALRRDDGVLIAWAFLCLDGTLIGLHCEEPYRGRGIARALACRLLRDSLKSFSDDGWGAADVAIGNVPSERVMNSLGGKPTWMVTWIMVDLSTAGDPL